MIDMNAESLIPLRDVPKLLPLRHGGKRIHLSAIYRWISRGIRGVRLDAIKVGGTTYTSSEAIQRFARGLSKLPLLDDTPAPAGGGLRLAANVRRALETELGITPDRER